MYINLDYNLFQTNIKLKNIGSVILHAQPRCYLESVIVLYRYNA